MGNWSGAQKSIDRSIRLLDENDVERGEVLFNYGGLLESRGQSTKAIDAYMKSLALLMQSRSRGALRVSVRLGDIHFSEGRFEQALKYYRKARTIHSYTSKPSLTRKESSEGIDMAQIREKLVNALTELGRWDECVDIINSEVESLKKSRSLKRLAEKYLQLGLALDSAGDPDDAIDSLLKARRILKERKDTRGLVAVDLNRGRILSSKGDERASVKCFETALANARKAGDRKGIETARSELEARND
jgi:tetratricopeptide (TPR) repeat protein